MADRKSREDQRLILADPGDVEEAAAARRRAARYSEQVIWILEQVSGVQVPAPNWVSTPAPRPQARTMSASQWEALTQVASEQGWQGVPPWTRQHAPTSSGAAWTDPLERVEQLRGHHAAPGMRVLCFEDGVIYRKVERQDGSFWLPGGQPGEVRRRVVRAETEAEARKLASRWPDGMLYLSWLEPGRSTCLPLELEGTSEVLA